MAVKYRADGIKDGTSSIELISNVYGRQAVVISVQPHPAFEAHRLLYHSA